MPSVLAVFVPGRPAPQGSKQARAIYRGSGANREFTGRVAQVESSKAVKPWREDVRARCLDAEGRPLVRLDDAVSVRLRFVMPRPLSTPKRHTPPATKKPDLDKLVRAVLDAIGSAGVWRDDSHVVELTCSKRIAEPGETTGCFIHVQPTFGPRSGVEDIDWRVVARRLAEHGGALSTQESRALQDDLLDAAAWGS